MTILPSARRALMFNRECRASRAPYHETSIFCPEFPRLTTSKTEGLYVSGLGMVPFSLIFGVPVIIRTFPPGVYEDRRRS